eukprot:gene27628-34094_t
MAHINICLGPIQETLLWDVYRKAWKKGTAPVREELPAVVHFKGGNRPKKVRYLQELGLWAGARITWEGTPPTGRLVPVTITGLEDMDELGADLAKRCVQAQAQGEVLVFPNVSCDMRTDVVFPWPGLRELRCYPVDAYTKIGGKHKHDLELALSSPAADVGSVPLASGAKIGVVIGRCSQPLEWLAAAQFSCDRYEFVIYDKCAAASEAPANVRACTTFRTISNKGQDISTFYSHIVDAYDSDALHSVTVYVPGEPDCGAHSSCDASKPLEECACLSTFLQSLQLVDVERTAFMPLNRHLVTVRSTSWPQICAPLDNLTGLPNRTADCNSGEISWINAMRDTFAVSKRQIRAKPKALYESIRAMLDVQANHETVVDTYDIVRCRCKESCRGHAVAEFELPYVQQREAPASSNEPAGIGSSAASLNTHEAPASVGGEAMKAAATSDGEGDDGEGAAPAPSIETANESADSVLHASSPDSGLESAAAETAAE